MKQLIRALTFAAAYMAFALLTLGCNKSFESATSTQQSAPAYDSSKTELVTLLTNLDALPVVVDASATDPLSQLNRLIPQVRYQSQLDVNFGDIDRILALGESVLKKTLWPLFDCSLVGSSLDFRSAQKQYRCGEIPYGNVVDSTNKEIFTLDFEGLTGSENGVSYQVSSAKIPLFLSRTQRPSQAQINHLTSKRIETVNVPSGILDTIYYRFSPESGNLISSICFFSPGLSLTAGEQKITVNAQKKVLFFKLKGSADIYVQPGTLSFSKAKVCSSFSTVITNAGPKFKFLKIEAPEFSDLAHKGLEVQAKVKFSGILALISNILKIVGINLEKKIQNEIVSQIKDQAKETFEQINDQDIKTGAWLSKYISQKIFKGKIVTDLEQNLSPQLDVLGPGSEVDLTAGIEASCIALSNTYAKSLRNQFQILCRNSFSIKAQFFLDAHDDRARGCYDHYFSSQDRGTSANRPWWTSSCRIKNSLEITAPEKLTPLFNCITQLLTDDPEKIVKAGACSKEIEFAQRLLNDQDIANLVDRAKLVASEKSKIANRFTLISEKYKKLFNR